MPCDTGSVLLRECRVGSNCSNGFIFSLLWQCCTGESGSSKGARKASPAGVTMTRKKRVEDRTHHIFAIQINAQHWSHTLATVARARQLPLLVVVPSSNRNP